MPSLTCSIPLLCYLDYLSPLRRHCISTSYCLPTNVYKHQYLVLPKQDLQFNAKYKSIVVTSASDNYNAEAAEPPKPSSPAWKKWMVGIMLTIILPSFRHKWGPLLLLQKNVDEAVETIESVTEAVEELAEAVEKLADEVEDKLPDDTKLKEVVESIENLAKQTVKEAKLAEELIHKVKEVEEEIEKSFDMDQAKVVGSKKQ